MKVAVASSDPALLPPAVKLARSLATLMRGLVYGMSSEGDHPYRPFSAVMAKETQLNAETFRKAARLGRRYHIQLDPASRFFAVNKDPEQARILEGIPVYALLEAIMHATLTDVVHARATGEDIVQVPVFIFGRCTDGSLAGLRSISIET